MAGKQLRRSHDKQLAGVCGGIAEHVGLEPNLVRLVLVALVITTGAVAVGAYLLAALVLPKPDAHGELAVDWQADGVRVVWPGAIAPHAVSWPRWLAGSGVVATLVVVAAAVLGPLAALATSGLPVDIELTIAPAAVPAAVSTLAVLLGLVGLSRRVYALTVTHDALWIERPLRRPLRVPLERVEAFHAGPDAVTIHLDDQVVRLPNPPDAAELVAVWEQVQQGRRRALEHHLDVEEARPRQRELERLVARRSAE